MKVIFYDSKEFEMPYFRQHMPAGMQVDFVKERLSVKTTALATGYEAVCIFTSDDASGEVITALKKNGVRHIAIRAAGYDNVEIQAANLAGLRVANVPEYSPYAVAEHAVALMLALNRKLVRSDKQVHRLDFTLDNLIGFDIFKKKVGIIGTGRIGRAMVSILHGFGCTLLAYDIKPDKELEHKFNVYYTTLNSLCSLCDIITLHVPLNDQTRYLINRKTIDKMKRGVMLINTSRGAVVNTKHVMEALPGGHIGYFGLDVYENEKGLFFSDHRGEELNDTVLSTLMNYSNVLITPHQGFATREALTNIAETTFQNLLSWQKGESSANEITCLEPATA